MNREKHLIPLIGVTGGIGCGMTAVSQILSQWGGVLISGDQVAREIMKKGEPAYQETLKVFGPEYLLPDGEFDRKKLGQHVFSNRDELEKLNKAVHPYWVEKIKEKVTTERRNAQPGTFIILDAALLIETGLDVLADKRVVVTAPMKERRQRICQRDNLDETQADQRIFIQMPVPMKVLKADYVIDNSNTLEDLKIKLQEIRDSLLSSEDVNDSKGDR